jgi:uncharacterized protein YjbI with pentapeptide repeats
MVHFFFSGVKSANLSGASFTGADLRHLDPEGADFSDATFSGKDQDGGVRLGADLRHARLVGADLRGAKLGGENLYEPAGPNELDPNPAGVEGGTLRDGLPGAIRLRGGGVHSYTDTYGTCSLVLTRRSLIVYEGYMPLGVDLRGADLRGALLDGADLRGALADETTRWPSGFNPAAEGVVDRLP